MKYFGIFFTIFTIGQAAGARLVATSPQVTELIFQLGKGADIVAGSPVNSLPQTKHIPNLGPAFAPSVERIVHLNTDAVILDEAWSTGAFLTGLKASHTRVISFHISNPPSLFSAAKDLLRKVYNLSESKVIAHYESCWDELGTKPATKPFRFLALAWASPPIVFSNSTYISGLLTRLGGVNVAPARGPDFPQVSQEWMLTRNFDVIYYLDQDPQSHQEMEKLMARWWPGRTGYRVVPLEPEWFSRATFTAFDHLNVLIPKEGVLPRACRI